MAQFSNRDLLIEEELRNAKTINERKEKLLGFSSEYVNEAYSKNAKWQGLRDTDDKLLKAGDVYLNEADEEVECKYDQIDWINGDQFDPVPKHMQPHLGHLLESIEENILQESLGTTGDQSPFRDMIIPTYRNAFAKFKMTDYVGFIPLSQPRSSIYVEKFFYGNNSTNPITNPITSARPRTQNTAVTFDSFVIRVVANDTVYNAITVGTSMVKAAGGAGANVAKIVYKEKGDVAGYAKLLVKLESGQTALPAVGTVYLTGSNADTTMTHTWNNEVGKRVILRSYGFLNTTSEGENLSDYLTVNIATDSMQVDAVPYKIGFEITDEAVQDLNAVNGIDAKKRLISAIQYQLAASVNMRLFNLASSNAEILSTFVYDDADGRWGNEKYIELIRKIIHEQTRMSSKSRRGVANWLITDTATSTIIQMEKGFVPMVGGGERGAGIIEIGRWMGMSIAVNTFALNNFVLLGYKGDEQLVSGVYYCTYIGLSVAFGTDYNNPMRKKVVFMERSAFAVNPDGPEQFLSYFDITYTGSVFA